MFAVLKRSVIQRCFFNVRLYVCSIMFPVTSSPRAFLSYCVTLLQRLHDLCSLRVDVYSTSLTGSFSRFRMRRTASRSMHRALLLLQEILSFAVAPVAV